jgi:cytidine deaminase
MEEVKFDRLGIIQQQLLKAAIAAQANAYCIYSHFAVGAALATPDGKIFEGANVENAAYGSGICAERAAICHANIKGARPFSDLAIVVSHKGLSTTKPSMPCGACRQVLYEFSSLHGQRMTIISATLNLDIILKATLDELLPRAFGPGDLGICGKP